MINIYIVVDGKGKIDTFFAPSFNREQLTADLKNMNEAGFYAEPIGYKLSNHSVMDYNYCMKI